MKIKARFQCQLRSKMSFSLIAAVGKNRELGKKGGLCFRIPGDLKFFKETTMGHPVFMGKTTFYSLPKMLPGREHYVLSLEKIENPAVHQVSNLDKFVDEHKNDDVEYFVIGGGSVYKQMLPYCQKLYLTEVNATDAEADTFFPEFDKNSYNREYLYSNHDGQLSYDHILYTKKGSL